MQRSRNLNFGLYHGLADQFRMGYPIATVRLQRHLV